MAKTFHESFFKNLAGKIDGVQLAQYNRGAVNSSIINDLEKLGEEIKRQNPPIENGTQ